MIKLYICCLVLIIGSVEAGPDIDMKFHQEVMEIVSYDIHSTAEEHMDDLTDLFKVLRKCGLKLSPHKCQFFKKKIVYMGLEFQNQGDKVCYTPLKTNMTP